MSAKNVKREKAMWLRERGFKALTFKDWLNDTRCPPELKPSKIKGHLHTWLIKDFCGKFCGEKHVYAALFYAQYTEGWYKWNPKTKTPASAATATLKIIKNGNKDNKNTKEFETTLASLYIAKKCLDEPRKVPIGMALDAIHDAWCCTNAYAESFKKLSTSRESQYVPYEKLSAEEKQKDMVWIEAVAYALGYMCKNCVANGKKCPHHGKDFKLGQKLHRLPLKQQQTGDGRSGTLAIAFETDELCKTPCKADTCSWFSCDSTTKCNTSTGRKKPCGVFTYFQLISGIWRKYNHNLGGTDEEIFYRMSQPEKVTFMLKVFNTYLTIQEKKLLNTILEQEDAWEETGTIHFSDTRSRPKRPLKTSSSSTRKRSRSDPETPRSPNEPVDTGYIPFANPNSKPWKPIKFNSNYTKRSKPNSTKSKPNVATPPGKNPFNSPQPSPFARGARGARGRYTGKSKANTTKSKPNVATPRGKKPFNSPQSFPFARGVRGTYTGKYKANTTKSSKRRRTNTSRPYIGATKETSRSSIGATKETTSMERYLPVYMISTHRWAPMSTSALTKKEKTIIMKYLKNLRIKEKRIKKRSGEDTGVLIVPTSKQYEAWSLDDWRRFCDWMNRVGAPPPPKKYPNDTFCQVPAHMRNMFVDSLECNKWNMLLIHPDKNPNCRGIAQESFKRYNTRCNRL